MSILAFEFWCTVGDREVQLRNLPQYKGYVEMFMKQLLEQILLNIKKFSVSQDDDEVNDWNLSKSSAYLLSLIVQLSKVDLIEELIQYVTSNKYH